METNKEIMVSVFMITYNHAKYIADAIEGVLSQKTDFKIELIIHDDASTDGTTEIVEKYAEKNSQTIIFIKEEENQYCKGIRMHDLLIPFASGKYVAICEGDDYWIDEYKLSKQISFLESHPDYSMCIHNAWQLNEKTQEKTLLNTFDKSGSYPLEFQVRCGLGTKFPATASYVYRMENEYSIPSELLSYQVGDYPIRVYNASRGNVYYFSEPMSIYRYLSNGSYMNNIRENIEKYIVYIKNTTKLYSLINQYLNYQFNDVFQKKIVSDYIGLATIMIQNNMEASYLDDLLDNDLFNRCMDILNENKMDKKLLDFCERDSNIWIYGTSNLAELIFKKLFHNGIDVNGFVVTDGYSKPHFFSERQVLYLSTLIEKHTDCSIIIAVQPINLDSIILNLKKNNIHRFYSLDFDCSS